MACLGIGLSLFVAELTGVYFTGGSLNPARSFGPAAVDRSFVGYHWIYWVGPILGAIIAAGFYKFIKVLEYETANPGQDMDHLTKVERKKKLLMAAGIGEHDAQNVALELTEKTAAAQNGGMDGTVMTNGTGQMNATNDPQGMYGTQFRSNSVRGHAARDSSGSDATYVQRPHAISTGSTLGRITLGAANRLGSRQASMTQVAVPAPRLDSPAMATNDELYAPLAEPGGMALGGMVLDQEPRSRFSRTISGGV